VPLCDTTVLLCHRANTPRPFPRERFRTALETGGVWARILRIFRIHTCEWDAMACIVAAQAGHLEALQWARANGCEWGRDECHEQSGQHPDPAVRA
jgi:hypothetical protein